MMNMGGTGGTGGSGMMNISGGNGLMNMGAGGGLMNMGAGSRGNGLMNMGRPCSSSPVAPAAESFVACDSAAVHWWPWMSGIDPL